MAWRGSANKKFRCGKCRQTMSDMIQPRMCTRTLLSLRKYVEAVLLCQNSFQVRSRNLHLYVNAGINHLKCVQNTNTTSYIRAVTHPPTHIGHFLRALLTSTRVGRPSPLATWDSDLKPYRPEGSATFKSVWALGARLCEKTQCRLYFASGCE